jgi:hypothetical protein
VLALNLLGKEIQPTMYIKSKLSVLYFLLNIETHRQILGQRGMVITLLILKISGITPSPVTPMDQNLTLPVHHLLSSKVDPSIHTIT